MSLSFQQILDGLDSLVIEELLSIQEGITKQLRHRLPPTNVFLPKLTPAQVETHLRELFGDEYDTIMATDISKLPAGSKSLSEMLIEDREDRI